MARMIDELLDVSRIREAGGLPIAPRATDLGEVVRDQLDELTRAHPGSDLRLTSSGELTGVWDPDRLAELVSNLVCNAIRHGRPGPIAVSLRDLGDRIELAVENGGQIPADELPTIFDPFSAGRAAVRSEGLGLGLFISRGIVEVHGGTITAMVSGGRTTMLVRLPRSAPVVRGPVVRPH